MLGLLGSRRSACDGLSRRDLLHVGGLGLFGLTFADLLRLQELQAAKERREQFGQARACIPIHLFGAAPQHETFAPKPSAPAEIQGEFKAIATSVPGVHIGEGLPRVARIADRLTLVRSLTHTLPFHGVHYSLSGIPTISPTIEADPNARRLWPFLGSVVDYLEEKRTGEGLPRIPRDIGLPFRLYSRLTFASWAGLMPASLRAVMTPCGQNSVEDVGQWTNQNGMIAAANQQGPVCNTETSTSEMEC